MKPVPPGYKRYKHPHWLICFVTRWCGFHISYFGRVGLKVVAYRYRSPAILKLNATFWGLLDPQSFSCNHLHYVSVDINISNMQFIPKRVGAN
jgi:hypothetical protein